MSLADDVCDATRRISGFTVRTPVFTSKSLNQLAGDRELFFKAECLQKTGSFKARGAINAVSKLVERSGSVAGVITHSSGNHGQALAYAAQSFGIPCTVVVPRNAPRVKIDAIRSYGANVIFCDPTMVARVACCEEAVKRSGQTVIHPHDDLDIISGQGTVAMELLDDCPDLDAILVPVGGGGLASGIALCAKHRKPSIKVYCVEPFGKDLEKSLLAGKELWPDPPGTIDTVADGMRTQRLGHNCFPIVSKLCEHTVFTVNDTEILNGMRLVWERLKLVVEPSAGTTVAAVMASKFQRAAKQENLNKIGLILCGGNIDLKSSFFGS